MVKEVTNLQEFKTLTEDPSKTVLVDFTATWCGPCKQIAPVFEKLSEQHKNVTFIKVDVDAANEIATACNIQAMPTFHLYVKGKKEKELQGANPAGLEALLQGL